MWDTDRKMEPLDLCAAEVAYYNKLASDLTRYRNFRWYIPIWTVSFLGAAAATGRIVSREPNVVRLGATVIIVGVAVVSIWQLRNCYRCYGENQQVVRDIECKYGLALGHTKWQRKAGEGAGKPRIDGQHRVFKWGWIILIILVALYALYCVWPQVVQDMVVWMANQRGASSS